MPSLHDQLTALEARFDPLHRALLQRQQSNFAASLRQIFTELKGLALGSDEAAQSAVPTWATQMQAQLSHLETLVMATDANVTTIANAWSNLSGLLPQLIQLAQQALATPPDDPRADAMAQQINQLSSQIQEVLQQGQQATGQTGTSSASGPTGGATRGSTGQTGTTGATGSFGSTGAGPTGTGSTGSAAPGSTGSGAGATGAAPGTSLGSSSAAGAAGATGSAGVSGSTSGAVSG